MIEKVFVIKYIQSKGFLTFSVGKKLPISPCELITKIEKRESITGSFLEIFCGQNFPEYILVINKDVFFARKDAIKAAKKKIENSIKSAKKKIAKCEKRNQELNDMLFSLPKEKK